jgi:beta-exotoxin I transport system ATP-binding protein
MKSTDAIAIHKLSKRYDSSKTYALDDVSLTVKMGEVYGFLGANGAGKSTTIRTLLNFIQPTRGWAAVLGYDVVSDSVQARKHLGYLAGEVALYSRMTGEQLLGYMSQLQPLKHREYVKVLGDKFEADLKKPLENLSKGNRQKIGLILALMHEPEVLVLDEPTSGLDPLMQEVFFAEIKEARKRGAGVFVSSHNFSEVQRMCDKVGFIREGKMVAEQRLEELETNAEHTFKLTFKNAAPMKELQKLPQSVVTPFDEHHVAVEVEGELTPLFKVLATHPVLRLEQQEVDLEKEFLKFYKSETKA